jgi:hypothetical protein
MTDFAHVTFDNCAQRASVDLLRATGLPLAVVEVRPGCYCVALCAADQRLLVRKMIALMAQPSFKRLAKHIGPAMMSRDDDGGWLLKFRLLIGRCETLH